MYVTLGSGSAGCGAGSGLDSSLIVTGTGMMYRRPASAACLTVNFLTQTSQAKLIIFTPRSSHRKRNRNAEHKDPHLIKKSRALLNQVRGAVISSVTACRLKGSAGSP